MIALLVKSLPGAAVITILADVVTDTALEVAAIAAGLTGLGLILRGVRKVFRWGDVIEKLPGRMDALERDRREDREEHSNAHAEMLSAVHAIDTRLDDAVTRLGERLDRLEEHAATEREHVRALTRDLDVPVRGDGEHGRAA